MSSHERTRRVARRAKPLCLCLCLCLASWGCGGSDSVEHQVDAAESEDGEAATTTYVFDPASVRTLRGTVIAVQPFQRMKGTRYGVRVRLDVDGERAYVYLAPQGFMAAHGLVLAPGDELEVTGSVLGEPGQRVVIAAEIVKDGRSFTLRDSEGDPAWS